MRKEELEEAEKEIMEILKRDEEPQRLRKADEVRETTGLPVSSLINLVSVILFGVAGVLFIREIVVLLSLPLSIFCFLTTFFPGVVVGVGSRISKESFIPPIYLAFGLGIISGIIGFLLIYTLPISILPMNIYPFGSSSSSMMELGLPIGFVFKTLDGSMMACMGFGMVFGVLCAKFLSRR